MDSSESNRRLQISVDDASPLRQVAVVGDDGRIAQFRLLPSDEDLRLLAVYDDMTEPRAIALQRTLFPSQVEGCVPGHAGVMCERCTPGYYKAGTGECVICPSS